MKFSNSNRILIEYPSVVQEKILNSESWHKILTLMTVIILIDKRVYKEEVDMFVESVNQLNSQISPDMFITEKMAFDWFVSNRDDVKKSLMDPDHQKNIDRLISSLKHIAGKQHILKALKAIALADSDLHKAEISIIESVSRIWGLKAA